MLVFIRLLLNKNTNIISIKVLNMIGSSHFENHHELCHLGAFIYLATHNNIYFQLQ